MADAFLSIWPLDNSRRVTKAEAQVVDAYQELYRIVFADSAGKQLAVQVPRAALEIIARTAAAILDEDT